MSTTQERLILGATLLGELHRQGERCSSAGWSALPSCRCQKPSKFCVARRQWVALATQDPDSRDFSDVGPYGLFLAMRASELAASKITITADNGVKLGEKGSCTVPMAVEIVSKVSAPIGAVAGLLASFKGSKVMGLS